MKYIIDISEEEMNKVKVNYNALSIDVYSMMLKKILSGVPIDNLKDEFIKKYPKNYAGEPELNGKAAHFTLNDVLKIIDKI